MTVHIKAKRARILGHAVHSFLREATPLHRSAIPRKDRIVIATSIATPSLPDQNYPISLCPPPLQHGLLYPQTRPLSIVIAGGSLASLITATILLSLPQPSHSINITILERLPPSNLQDLGAGIAISPSILAFMSRYCNHLPPPKYAAPLHAYRQINREGKVTTESEGKGQFWATSWGQLYRVLRGRFDELSDDGRRGRYLCEAVVESIVEDGDRVVVSYREKGESKQLAADLVVGADGASSTVRGLLLPEVKRYSVGYACYRGIVAASQVSLDAQAIFQDMATFHWAPRSQMLSYMVPGNGGPADEIGRYINWVWYQIRDEKEMEELLTDKDGKKHKFSLPPGKMRLEEIEKIKMKAGEELPEVHKEIIRQTDDVFLQVVTDSHAGGNSFCGGKVVLVGDAVAGQRPHVASAVMQAVFDAEWLARLVQGLASPEEFEEETQSFSKILVEKGKELGAVCMGDFDPTYKDKTYYPLFFGTQALLKAKFDKLDELNRSSASNGVL
ncbi:2,6-dihydroxypyridine 3-monooxygenase [Cyphellophora attinorum]|uniref:2,6-dihydroxypyridine 3-monooxygenase n=1 Tax=Cyphellophora attinorum TaxID=1664694 RepID=A0A0N1HFA7_9EURO|nr:2,6-dihydroxypyridine 3-monooxygenase [Phialophora attinorum]KPI44376.1 2,6-dihydroxypyridine 3-monooxygenase [Phialophora attinorum]